MTKKILHVVNDLWYGGGMENVLFNLIDGTPEHKHHIALPFEHPNMAEKHTDRRKLMLYRWERVDQLARIIDRKGFDVVHLHWTGWGKGYMDLPRFLKSKPLIVVTAHGNIPIKAGNAFGFDHVISVSKSVSETQAHVRSNHQIIYNGIDTWRFGGYRAIDRDPSRPIIGRICRLDEKTPENLVSTFKSFDLPEARYWIVGYGHQRDKFIQQADEQFWIPGGVSDPERLLSYMDVVAYPVLAEGFGLSVVEAMAMQVPVVAYRVGGIPEIITNHYDGITVNNDEQMKYWVRWLINNPDERKAMGKRARETVEARFSIKTMCDQYRQVYNQPKPERNINLSTEEDILQLMR